MKELTEDQLKVMAFEAYQQREMAQLQIQKAIQVIQQVNTELAEREQVSAEQEKVDQKSNGKKQNEANT